MKAFPVVYSQRDPKWSGQRLGTVNGTTIGSDGCYVTSFATIGRYFGHDINPAQLDDIMTNQKLYVSGNLMVDNNLQKVFADCVYQQTLNYQTIPADLGKLKDLLADPSIMVVLEVDFSPEKSGLQTHFIVAADCDGVNVQVADAWTGTIHDIKTPYGDPKTTIQKYVIYKGPTPQPTVAVPADKFKELVDKSTKYDAFNAAGFVNVDAVNLKVNDLNNQIKNLNDKINKAKTDIDKVKADLG